MKPYLESRDTDPDDSLFIQEMELYYRASAYSGIRRAYAGKEIQLIELAISVAEQLFKNSGVKPSIGKVVGTIARRT